MSKTHSGLSVMMFPPGSTQVRSLSEVYTGRIGTVSHSSANNFLTPTWTVSRLAVAVDRHRRTVIISRRNLVMSRPAKYTRRTPQVLRDQCRVNCVRHTVAKNVTMSVVRHESGRGEAAVRIATYMKGTWNEEVSSSSSSSSSSYSFQTMGRRHEGVRSTAAQSAYSSADTKWPAANLRLISCILSLPPLSAPPPPPSRPRCAA